MRTSLRRLVVLMLGAALIVGGTGLLVRAQLLQPVGTWAFTGSTAPAATRTGAATVTLEDGRTLIAGGLDATGTATTSVVIYNPVTNESLSVGELADARVNASAALLEDGRVVVTGGHVGALISADVEVFDPLTHTSTVVATMSARTLHASARLADGGVLIVGGRTPDGTVLATAELFDPATNLISPVWSAMATARAGASATRLLDGRVLVAGGHDGIADLASAEIYNPFDGSFSAVPTPLSVARAGHTAVLLPHNNAVLMAGGTAAGAPVTTSDLFLPALLPDPYSWGVGSFAPTGPMVQARSQAVAGPAGDYGYAYIVGGGPAQGEAYRFATIKTDKDDYAPGEQAIITGSGWQPGEGVRLVFQEDPAVHDDYVIDRGDDGNPLIVANASGEIYWDQWAPDQHDLGVRFYLMATGSHSKAQTTFTDGAVTGATVTIKNPSGAVCGTANSNFPLGAAVCGTFAVTASGPGTTNFRLHWYAPGDLAAGNNPVRSTNASMGNGVTSASFTDILPAASNTTAGTWDVLVCDNTNNQNCQTAQRFGAVTFIVTGANTAPAAASQSVSTAEDVALAITLTGTDTSPASLTFAIVTGPGAATGTLGSLGAPSCSGGTCTSTVTFTPAGNYNGPASFTFKTNDGSLDSTNGTVNITVRPANDAPVAADGTATTAEDVAVAIDLGALVSDIETTDANLSYVIDSPPTPAQGGLSGSGASRTFTPTLNFNGTATFTYHVVDRGDPDNCSPVTPNVCTAALSSAVKTVTITVTPVNDAPVAIDAAFNTTEDGPAVSLDLAALVSDAETADADLTYVIDSGPSAAQGVLSLTGATRSFAPAADFNGLVNITYHVVDRGDPDNCTPGPGCSGALVSGTQTLAITVYPKNDAPVAADGTATTAEDVAVAIDLGALVSDIETPNANLSYVIDSPPAPAHGGLSGSGASRTFTPTLNFNGTATFTYHVVDRGDPDNCSPVTPNVCTAALSSAVKTVTITVTPVNDAPANLSLSLMATTIAEGGLTALSGSFTDVETGDSHTVHIDWGDLTTTSIPLGAGVLTIPPTTHTYLDDNPTNTASDSYAIIVTVTDDGTTGLPPVPAPMSTNAGTSVTVNNVLPVAGTITATPAVIAIGAGSEVRLNFTDVGVQDTHTCTFTWDGALGTPTPVVTEASGSGYCKATQTFTTAGVYTVRVTLNDDDLGTASVVSEVMVVVYDPSAGFVTGGGFINSPAGAYRDDLTLVGKANFGFVSKYKRGASTPTGETEFQFKAGSLNFHGSTYQWLVVAGTKAQYKGEGTLNGAGDYGFMLTATDGQLTGGGGVDKFRIKIWNTLSGAIVYDNNFGASDDIDAANPQAISGGSIVIHK